MLEFVAGAIVASIVWFFVVRNNTNKTVDFIRKYGDHDLIVKAEEMWKRAFKYRPFK